MKTTIKILLLTAIMTINLGCENATPPTSGVSGLEGVYGVVSNVDKEPLEGIMVEAYYDKELTKCYPEEEKRTIYTNSEGFYSIRYGARGGLDSLEIYVKASDTTGVYETQIQKGVIRYSKIIWEHQPYDISGDAKVDFVLTKK